MTPLALAWRSLTRQPARAALGIAGIAAVGALLLDMLLLSRGLLISFEQLLNHIGFDVRVTATSSFPMAGPEIEDVAATLSSLRALPQVEEVIATRFASAEALVPGPGWSSIDLIGHGVGESGGGRRGGIGKLIEGRGLSPVASGHREILINRSLARALRLRPGSSLSVRLWPAPILAPALACRVAGTVDLPFDTASDLTAVTDLDTFAAVSGDEEADAADLLLVASRPDAGPEAAVAAIRRVRPDLYAFSNAQFLDRFQRTDFSYFRQIAFVLSSITVFFAVLLVGTLLTVSVNQRFGEIAGLRALGFSRGRVARDLLWESALLVGAGGLLSLPLGAGLARALDQILRSMPGLPQRLHFFVFEPRALILHAGLLAGTAMAAALYPILLAARLPIAATLRKETV